MTDATKDNLACCTLCPALCSLELAWNGPDIPRVEFPPAAGTGVCPRGSALGELLASAARVRWPRRREGERWVDLNLPEALSAAAERMSAGATVFLDGNLPLEQLAAAAEIADGWDGVGLCLVVNPDDEQVLLGVEASGAHYLADEELGNCDGFVFVGDGFAANPRCARGVLDVLESGKRAPLVVIDSGAGVAGGFATLVVPCAAGGELGALKSKQVSSAVDACRKLGVVIAPEAGRGDGWRRLGYVAGKLASSHGGGVAVQTAGANALAAVRLANRLKLLSLAQAVATTQGVRVALGVDLLGLLGWSGPAVAVAAAAVANETTKSAELILPTALACEMGGTFLQAGTRSVKTAPLLAPPAGVPTPTELLGALAAAAGVKVSAWSGKLPSLERLALGEPADVAAASASTNGRRIVAATRADRDTGGALAGKATWQSQVQSLPELRVARAEARELGLADLAEVTVETDSHAAAARVRVVDRLAAGTLAISAGYPEARKLVPYVVDAEQDGLASHPAPARVSR